MDAFLPEFDFPLEPEDETLLYLSFKTHRERDEWFTIFRALAKVTAYTRRRHRRLDLSIMDLNESLTGVGRASVPGEDTLSVSSTSTDTHRRTLRKPEIVVESERLFPQWSKTEAIKVEV
jgi:hypothetical protein